MIRHSKIPIGLIGRNVCDYNITKSLCKPSLTSGSLSFRQEKMPKLYHRRSIDLIGSSLVTTQLWTIWPGNNRFKLNGKLMFGPKTDNCYFIPTVIVLLLSPLLFLYYMWGFISEEISTMMPYLIMFWFFPTIVFFAVTVLSDPGIIPRKAILLANNKGRNRYFEFQNPSSLALIRKFYKQRNYCHIC